jgi:uncharacterized membrane protein YidH (DUF202 family)
MDHQSAETIGNFIILVGIICIALGTGRIFANFINIYCSKKNNKRDN